MATQQKAQPQGKATRGDQAEPNVDQDLQQQIVDAVEPLISDLSEQLSQTVRASFRLEEEQQDDDRPEASRPRQRRRKETSGTDAARDASDDEPATGEIRAKGKSLMVNREQRQSDTQARNGNRQRDDQKSRRSERRSSSTDNRAGGRRALVPLTQTATQIRRPQPGEGFSPDGAIPVMLLKLGRTSRDSGAIHTAIHAYMQVIERYPDSGASRAAIEQLLELADHMQEVGRFYTALGILNRIEELYGEI